MSKKEPIPTTPYNKQIIKALERINNLSGYNPYQVLDDFLRMTEATLEALPQHLKAIARTGHWAEDTSETAETFARIRTRYESGHNPSASQRAWESFGQAFALLLESAAPGLWAFGPSSLRPGSGEPSLRTGDNYGYMGPDVLGQVFMEFTHPDPHQGQFLTPWPVVLMMSQFTGGKKLVYDRLKQACQHPDNILAQATLLAGLAIEDSQQAQEWFITRVVPAALPHFEIIKVCDPCVGSGRMLLGMASQFEPWMVQMGLVQFFGMDTSPLLVRVSKINCYLYGLNGYALRLAEAVNEVMEIQRSEHQSLPLPQFPQAALDQATRWYRSEQSGPRAAASPTFEELFKATAQADHLASRRYHPGHDG
jgi:hypothetical protein